MASKKQINQIKDRLEEIIERNFAMSNDESHMRDLNYDLVQLMYQNGFNDEFNSPKFNTVIPGCNLIIKTNPTNTEIKIEICVKTDLWIIGTIPI